MLRSGGQNEDRNYEVRLNSFSDGSAKYHGYNVPKGTATSKPPAVVEVGRSGGDPDMTTRDMINAGYSAFANFKR